ncbi:MAG: DUF2218 domain-containing protein, partial [Pseudomonadota bacterium]
MLGDAGVSRRRADRADVDRVVKSIAHLKTANGSKYIQAMCKHFAHKVEVTYSEMSGSANLPDGRLSMKVCADGSLAFEVVAEDVDKLEKTQDVVTSHLVRFAAGGWP